VTPAIDPFVITTGATDIIDPTKRDDDLLATFSPTASESRPVDVVAPGVSVESARVPGSTVDRTYPASRTSDGRFTRGSGRPRACTESPRVASGEPVMAASTSPRP
jgi:serine protease AprX